MSLTKRTQRSREEMIEGILTQAREPKAGVVKIAGDLFWKSWLSIRDELTKKGMLIMVDGYYRTTDKGLEWLELRRRMKAV